VWAALHPNALPPGKARPDDGPPRELRVSTVYKMVTNLAGPNRPIWNLWLNMAEPKSKRTIDDPNRWTMKLHLQKSLERKKRRERKKKPNDETPTNGRLSRTIHLKTIPPSKANSRKIGGAPWLDPKSGLLVRVHSSAIRMVLAANGGSQPGRPV